MGLRSVPFWTLPVPEAKMMKLECCLSPFICWLIAGIFPKKFNGAKLRSFAARPCPPQARLAAASDTRVGLAGPGLRPGLTPYFGPGRQHLCRVRLLMSMVYGDVTSSVTHLILAQFCPRREPTRGDRSAARVMPTISQPYIPHTLWYICELTRLLSSLTGE
jgi:hypothetical protein